MPGKVLLMSDIHLCHLDWYGMTGEDRMEKMVEALNAAYEADPYDAIFFLGDYSLDHWLYHCGGSWVHQKISNTKKLTETYLSRLRCPARWMIPGNHEQYGPEWWRAITGCDRQFAVMHQGWLFLMLDNFAAGLDPQQDSDGTYTPTDVDFIRDQLAQHPEAPVVLCAHFFDMKRETEAFRQLVRDESRIVCLFCGHDHINRIQAPAELGGRLIIHDGHFSYAIAPKPQQCPWGWLQLTLHDGGLACAYVWPESTIQTEEGTVQIAAGRGPDVQIGLQEGFIFPRR